MATTTQTIETWRDGVLIDTRQVQVVTTPEQDNDATIRQQAASALANNRAFVASTPTAAQTTAQVKALSRQVNGLIRLLLNQLDGTD
jgi:hypothetical protein